MTIKPDSIRQFEEIPIEQFDPFLPEYVADPYPVYNYLRSKAPVHWSPKGIWIVTSYSEVVTILTHSQFSRKLQPTTGYKNFLKKLELNPVFKMQSHWMLFKDPPEHTRLRTLVNQAFTAKMVEKMYPRIQLIVDKLLDNVQEVGTMDVLADLAKPLSTLVTAEMIGVPTDDREIFEQWLGDIFDAIDITNTPEAIERGNKATLAFIDYFCSLVRERRKAPKEDLITSLIIAEEKGNKLSEAEIFATCIMLLAGGNETTMNLIGNGTFALLRHPDEINKLRENPYLIQTAVEELLRYDSPAPVMGRRVAENIKVGGKLFYKGQEVKVVLGAANRDPVQFSNPDCLDITRSDNRHVSLGRGVHTCVGASLTRAEGQIAINTLIKRMPNLKLQTDSLEWRNKFNIRGLKSLPVSF